MGASKDRQKFDKRKKLVSCITAGIIALLILALVLINAFAFPLRYLSTLFSLPSVSSRAENELAVHFIDVGQGDASLIELPDGKTMLIDGGGTDVGARNQLLRYLRALKIKKLDYLMLTHPDSDHCGGLDDVLELFGAREIYMPYCPDSEINAAYGDFVAAVQKAAKRGAAVHISQTYSTIVSENVNCFYYAMILSPLSVEIESSYYRELENGNSSDSATNDCSAVLYLEYAGVRLLFTGDVTERVESDLCTQYEQLGDELFAVSVDVGGESVELRPRLENIDVLKVAHHGSSGSTSEKFAELLSPDIALIGVGAENLYGHPSPSVSSRLLASNPDCKIYRTDELGNIVLRINPSEDIEAILQRGKALTYRKKSYSEFI